MSLVRIILECSFWGWKFPKRIGYLSILAVLTVLVLPDTSSARLFKVFGLESFVRSSGEPATEVREFQVKNPNDSEFNLHLFYAGIIEDFKGTVPSAVVTLNGQVIVTPDEFNRNVHYIKKGITLSASNSLSIELRGKPGSGIRVVITGRNDEPQVVYFDKDILPDGSSLLGSGLRYLWTIIEEPDHGSAVLSDPFSASPLLSVDKPGQYILQLIINGDAWESEPLMVTLTATQYPPFVPVPIQTRVISGDGTHYQDYSIKVGSNTYTAPAPVTCGSPDNQGFQVLVLDRSTLAFRDHQTYNVPCGISAMMNSLMTLDPTSIVIVSSLYTTFDRCGSECSMVGMILSMFGGSQVMNAILHPYLSYTLPDGTFVPFTYSLIGVAGISALEGAELNTIDHKIVRKDTRMDSNISGSFVKDVNSEHLNHWTFVSPEFVEIEARSQPGALVNTIKVGGTSYRSRTLSTGGGFQVLWLDQDTLQPAAIISSPFFNRTYSTNAGAGNDSVSAQEQQNMETDLTYIKALAEGSGQKLIAVISSVGTPIQYKSSAFHNLSGTIGYWYGGTSGVFYQLGTAPDAISTYSLVGALRTGAPYGRGASGWVEASSKGADSQKERLRVVMHKDKKGWFVPAVTAEGEPVADGGPDFSLLSVALQPATPWPLPDPGHAQYEQEVAAYRYISRQMGENTDDIRSFYVLSPIDPGGWWSTCTFLQYPSTTPSPYFSEADFAAMKEQLCSEFNYVSHVDGFLEDMDTVLTNMQISSTSNLGKVYDAVKATVFVPEDSMVMCDAGMVIRGLLTAGTSIITNPVIKGAMGVLNGAMSIAMSFSKKPGGADYTSIDTTASSLGDEMNNLWASCRTGKDLVLDMVKSDWGKLRYVGNKFMTAPEEGGWKYYNTDPNDWVTIVTNSLEAYYFQSLLPAVWKIDYLEDSASIPAPKYFRYNAGGSYTCNPYCNGSSANPTAYWVDSFLNGRYTWYVLENGIDMAKMSGCGYVVFDRSASLRSILFGSGDWKDSAGNRIGVKLNLYQPLFYERWLPSSVYRPPTMPLFDEVDGYYGNCSD